MSGSEVRVGETGLSKEKPCAPARPYVRHEAPLNRVR